MEIVRPRKRLRADAAQIKDKFNLSNDHFYEVAKDGGRHRVRQTFGQLVVEHAYPAQKLQLPFVSTPVALLPPVYPLSIANSTKRVYRSKKLAPSIAPHYSSRPILKFALAKSVLQRRRKTSPAGNLAKAVMSEKASIELAISAYAIRVISCYGSTR